MSEGVGPHRIAMRPTPGSELAYDHSLQYAAASVEQTFTVS
jgi:hypothetical protein